MHSCLQFAPVSTGFGFRPFRSALPELSGFSGGSGMRLLMKLLISGEKPGKPLWLALLMTDSSGPFRIFISNSFMSWMNVGYYFNLFPQRHWITGISAVVEWSRTGKHLWAVSRRDSNETRMPQRHRITGNAAIAANGHHVHRFTDPQENLSPASLWFWSSDERYIELNIAFWFNEFTSWCTQEKTSL